MNTVTVRSCSLCASDSTFVKYDVGTCNILRCRNCTFMWLDPQPSAAELREAYGDETYYRNERFFESGTPVYGYHDYAGERSTRLADLQRVLDTVAGLLPSSAHPAL